MTVSPSQDQRINGTTEPTEHVGLFEMGVTVAEASDKSADRWTQRAQILATWLAAEWQREQRAKVVS